MDIMPDFDLIDREYAYDGELCAFIPRLRLRSECGARLHREPC